MAHDHGGGGGRWLGGGGGQDVGGVLGLECHQGCAGGFGRAACGTGMDMNMGKGGQLAHGMGKGHPGTQAGELLLKARG